MVRATPFGRSSASVLLYLVTLLKSDMEQVISQMQITLTRELIMFIVGLRNANFLLYLSFLVSELVDYSVSRLLYLRTATVMVGTAF